MTQYEARPRTYKLIADRLVRAYGAPSIDPLPLGNKQDPLDELIYIILTVMTQYGVGEAYANLRRRFPSWDALLRARQSTVTNILQPIGLSAQRARRIRAILREIKRREGSVDLRRLHRLRDADAEAYLVTLPGVGRKVARCVMLYSLRREVFPVDAHVLRVLKRLGLADSQLALATAQDELQARVPEILRYTLHVNLVVHGRTACLARRPKCEHCVLSTRCPSAVIPSVAQA